MERSQPALLPWLQRSSRRCIDKAYRFVGEMEEIADYVGEDASAQEMFDAFADFYTRLANDFEGRQDEVKALSAFLAPKKSLSVIPAEPTGPRFARPNDWLRECRNHNTGLALPRKFGGYGFRDQSCGPPRNDGKPSMRTQVGSSARGPRACSWRCCCSAPASSAWCWNRAAANTSKSRVRAGVLEQGTVDLMAELGVDERLRRECMIDEGLDIRFAGRLIQSICPSSPAAARRDLRPAGGGEGSDRGAARARRRDPVRGRGDAARRHRRRQARRSISATMARTRRWRCDIVAGCDGFHGVCRPAIPEGVLTVYDREFPFGWLGILSESPPIAEMTYSNHERGFALCSRRSPKISRLYVQCRSTRISPIGRTRRSGTSCTCASTTTARQRD